MMSFDYEMVALSNMPPSRWLKLIDELGDMQVMSVLLTGGEPKAHPDLFTIIEATSGNDCGILSDFFCPYAQADWAAVRSPLVSSGTDRGVNFSIWPSGERWMTKILRFCAPMSSSICS